MLFIFIVSMKLMIIVYIILGRLIKAELEYIFMEDFIEYFKKVFIFISTQ